MQAKITFWGAARTTTGSMHMIETPDSRFLLECGLFQGRRKEAFERNRTLPFQASSIDKVLLSHAHMDHAGNLPTLVRNGFRGEIVATPASIELCDIMLRDSAHIHEKDVEFVNRRRIRQGKKPFEPLYRSEDIDPTMERFRPLDYGEALEIAPGIRAVFNDAGHLLGSSTITVDFDGGTRERLFFTGDLGRADMPILRDPVTVKDVDVLITESTYGNRTHPQKADVQGRLKAFVEDITAQRSKLIIPSFSVGRTQELLYFLHELYAAKRIPNVPVFVDSPLSTRATEVYEHHPDCYDAETVHMLLNGDTPFRFRNAHYLTSVQDSMKLNDMPGPVIVISSSGMCEGGRILHHLAHSVGDPKNIILFVGYQAENTLGRRLVEHASPVRIHGEEYEVCARIHTINALSAHADRNEILDYVAGMGNPRRRAFVVHGETEQAESLAAALRDTGVKDVSVPEPGARFDLLAPM